MKNFLKNSLMFWWKLLDEFVNAPWRVEESPLTHLPVRQGGWNDLLGHVKRSSFKRVNSFYGLCLCVPIYESLRFTFHRCLRNEWSTAHSIERWTVWRVREACYMYMRIRVREIIIRCSINLPWRAAEKLCWITHLQISELAIKLQKVAKKYAVMFGGYVVKQ